MWENYLAYPARLFELDRGISRWVLECQEVASGVLLLPS
jgi:hypothetical protein